MIKEFRTPKEYNNYRRDPANKYIQITDRFGNGYTVKDNFNLIADTESDKLAYIDEFEDHKKEYTYKDIAELKELMQRHPNITVIFLSIRGGFIDKLIA